MTLIEKLRAIQQLKTGDPMPEWMYNENGWGEPLSQICGEAADALDLMEAIYDKLREVEEDLADYQFAMQLLFSSKQSK